MTYNDESSCQFLRRTVLRLGDQADEIADETDHGHESNGRESARAEEGISIVASVLDRHRA